MKTLAFILCVVTLPWQSLFRNDMGFGEDAVWAAMEISSLDVDYRQGTRAGLWGLTPEVATSFGLRVDKWMDERFDARKASQAAALYLDALIVEYDNDTMRALMVLVNTPYRQVGDKSWVTPGRCRHEVSKDVLDKVYASYNMSGEERDRRYAVADSLKRADAVARQQARETEQKIQAKSQEAARKASKTAANGVHVVKAGETLSHIARVYNCTVSQLMAWNNLKSDLLQIGQKIKVRK